MLKKVLLASVFALGLGLMTMPALADNIPIVNGSFESSLNLVNNCGPGCFFWCLAMPFAFEDEFQRSEYGPLHSTLLLNWPRAIPPPPR